MNLEAALKGIKETQSPMKAREPKPQAPSTPPAPAPAPEVARPQAAALPREKAPSRPVGKSANPDYERVTLYARKDLRRQAERKFEDEGGRDLSDLFERFLLNYLKAKRQSADTP